MRYAMNLYAKLDSDALHCELYRSTLRYDALHYINNLLYCITHYATLVFQYKYSVLKMNMSLFA